MVQCAVGGLQKAGIFSLLADGNFTLGQLVTSARTVPESKGQGVYARIFLAAKRKAIANPCNSYELLAEQHKPVAETRMSISEQCDWLAQQRVSSLYIGSSPCVCHQMASSDYYFASMYANRHASMYTKAGRNYYRVLCDLNDNVHAQKDGHIRLVVEQLLIILLGTFVRDLRTFHKVYAFLGEERMRWRTKAGDKEAAKMSDMDRYDSYLDRSVTTALTLEEIGSDVCAKCGWQPITRRSDSNGQLGTPIRPLNWHSPIHTNMDYPRKPKLLSVDQRK